MTHKNKTLKYSIDTSYQNISYLWIKSQLEKDAISAGPISSPNKSSTTDD